MKYYAGRVVEGGYFLDVSTWEILTMPKGGGYLPGGKEKSYYKIPLLVIIAAGPVVGLVYTVVLPAASFLSLLHLMVGAVSHRLKPWKNNIVPI